PSLALLGQPLGVRIAGEHHVAALEIGANVVETRAGEELSKRRHRDPVMRADVDPAEQHYLSHPNNIRLGLRVPREAPDHADTATGLLLDPGHPVRRQASRSQPSCRRASWTVWWEPTRMARPFRTAALQASGCWVQTPDARRLRRSRVTHIASSPTTSSS